MSSRLARRTSRSVTSSPCWLSSSRTNAVASAVECTNASPSRDQRTSASRATWRASWSALPAGDDPAVGQDQDAVGELLRLVEVVGGEQDRRALEVREPVHEVVELAPRVRVEAGGRLVEEQQLRPPDDPDRHVEAPALPAGERDDLLVGELGQADHLEQRVDRDGPLHLGRRVGRVVAAELASRRRGVHLGWSRQDCSTTPVRARQSSPARAGSSPSTRPRPPTASGSPRGSRSSSSSRRRWGRAGRSPRRAAPRTRRRRARRGCRSACAGRARRSRGRPDIA